MAMSALGQKQTFAVQNVMSALPLIADICSATRYVGFVPIADMVACLRCPLYSQMLRLHPHDGHS